MSKRIKIEFDVIVPDVEHTESQLMDWLRFELGDNGADCKSNNPFLGYDVEPSIGTFKKSNIYQDELLIIQM